MTAYLCLADKSQKTPVDGLNQLFLLYKDEYRTRVKIKENASIHTVGNRILTEINIDEIVNRIINSEFLPDEDFKTFAEIINFYSNKYENDKRIFPKVSGKCKSCEFKATKEERAQGYKSGFHECWQDATSLKEDKFDNKPLILDIWDYGRKDELIKSGMCFMEQITRKELEGSSGKRQKQADYQD